MTGQIWQTSEPIYITQHIQAHYHQTTWIEVAGNLSSDSIIAFDHDGRMIYANNRFGSLDEAKKKDLKNIKTVFKYLRCRYHNAIECGWLVAETLHDLLPRKFDLLLINNTGSVLCRAWPVSFTDRLLGVILVAVCNNNGSEIRDRERDLHHHESNRW